MPYAQSYSLITHYNNTTPPIVSTQAFVLLSFGCPNRLHYGAMALPNHLFCTGILLKSEKAQKYQNWSNLFASF